VDSFEAYTIELRVYLTSYSNVTRISSEDYRLLVQQFLSDATPVLQQRGVFIVTISAVLSNKFTNFLYPLVHKRR
jgi:hypothetical protein